MIFVARGVFCQIIPHKTAFPNGLYSLKSVVQKDNKLNFNTNFSTKKNNNPVQKITNTKPGIPLSLFPYFVISANHYTQGFGFFCKKELQFEKATKVPFKFRLGTVQYCDWMEGKPNATNPF